MTAGHRPTASRPQTKHRHRLCGNESRPALPTLLTKHRSGGAMKVFTQTASEKRHKTTNEIGNGPIHLYIDLCTGKTATESGEGGYTTQHNQHEDHGFLAIVITTFIEDQTLEHIEVRN